MICNFCQEFWESAVSSGAVRTSHHEESVEWAAYTGRLGRDAAELESSLSQTISRCSICVCVWFSLTESEKKIVPKNAVPILELQLGPTQTKPTLRSKFVDEDGKEVLPMRTIAIFDRESQNESISAIMQKCSRLDNTTTGSDASMAMARFWLKECLVNHEKCPKPRSDGFLPTRVIDVGSESDSPRLCETKNLHVRDSQRRFIALSHCWGLDPPLRTTLDTLLERLDSIPLETLPAVFRDAVITTRKLDIPYLWIDSLCILQDSKSDWEAESVQMCKIYQSAIVTIASAHSSSSKGGLFVKRDGYRIASFEVEVQLPQAATPHKKRFRFIPMPRREISWDMDDLPLYRRAWTFQELVLAPRTLIFDPDSLRFECLAMHGSESSPDGGIARHHNAIKKLQDVVTQTVTDGLDSFDKLGADEPLQSAIWHHVVSDYTSRNLTKQTDRLIAVAGVADALQQATKNQYLAGLWRDNLPIQLLWFVRTRFDPPNDLVMTRDQLPSRPAKQIAPSWSWASCQAPVLYQPLVLSRPMCEARSAHVAGTPYAQSGKIGLFGDTRSFRVWGGNKSIIKEAKNLQRSSKLRFKGEYGIEQSLIWPDGLVFVTSASAGWKYRVEVMPGQWLPDEEVGSDAEITFLAISRTAPLVANRSIDLRRAMVYSIALASTGQAGEYRRVGYAEWQDCAWFGYECAEDYEHKKDCWAKLERSWGRIKPPKLGIGREHSHPIEHDPFVSLSAYHPSAGVNRRELTII